eukprot:15464544-Alexandrium_andersonii.AAC.1
MPPSEGPAAAAALLPLGVVVLEGANGRRGHLQPAEGSRHCPIPADHRRDRAHALASRHVAGIRVGPDGDLLQAVAQAGGCATRPDDRRDDDLALVEPVRP